MSRSTYKSLRRREAAVQKQLKRAQALCARLGDQLETIRENIWQTETGRRLRKEAGFAWLAQIREMHKALRDTESDSDA